VSVYLALLLTFMLFSLLVMAIDVGRLYMVQGELQTAVDAAALAAATRLNGNYCATLYADNQMLASFDSTVSPLSGTANDNRFNMRLYQISPNSDVPATPASYYSLLADAQAASNPVTDGPSARYVRVELSVAMPVIFTRFLSLTRPATQPVAVAGIAGISSAVCTACQIDPLAVTAVDGKDPLDYGFQRGSYYTMYLSASQRPPGRGCAVPPAPLDAGDAGLAEYRILNHYPTGPATDADGQAFSLGAAPMAKTSPPDVDPPVPGCVSISVDSSEQLNPNFTTTAPCGTATQLGVDFLCGLNTRFLDSATLAGDRVCSQVPGIETLAPLYGNDVDPGAADGLQDYAAGYCGNQRRVLTVAVLDPDLLPDLLVVLNFRQFLVENAAGLLGLDVSGTSAPPYLAALRAQYIGYPAPIASGTVGGACITSNPQLAGPGRPVLHGISNVQ
jgi:Flp pilus assembly protein TadG